MALFQLIVAYCILWYSYYLQFFVLQHLALLIPPLFIVLLAQKCFCMYAFFLFSYLTSVFSFFYLQHPVFFVASYILTFMNINIPVVFLNLRNFVFIFLQKNKLLPCSIGLPFVFPLKRNNFQVNNVKGAFCHLCSTNLSGQKLY